MPIWKNTEVSQLAFDMLSWASKCEECDKQSDNLTETLFGFICEYCLVGKPRPEEVK